MTVISAASEVLKELGDSPIYLQTQEGSIETYKMRYGRAPLMPLSLSLWFLGDIPRADIRRPSYNDLRVFPDKTLGEAEFKVLYGSRQLVARSTPVGFEQMPGVKNLLDGYNGITPKREQIDEGRYLRFAQAVITGLRYLVDARSFKTLLATSSRIPIGTLLPADAARSLSARDSIIGNQGDGLTNFNAGAGSTVYVLAGGDEPQVNAQVVVSVVESSNQDEEATKISDRIGGALAGVGNNREMEQIFNLIDMNIIPINVHALMRGIPLANLYNYEFTFEQMAASMFGEQMDRFTAAGGLSDGSTHNTRQMFLRLLINPYMTVIPAMYGSGTQDLGSAGFVQRIFRGDNNLGMGRPKFLSDQLWNKALFGSVYQTRSDYDESGPSTGVGAARGQGAVIGPIQNALRGLTAIRAEIAADRATFLGPQGAGNAAGLAAATAAGGAAAAQARARVDDLVYGPNGFGAHIAKWASQVGAYVNSVPGPNPRAAVTAISNLLMPTRAPAAPGAHNLGDLLAAISALGANKDARVAAPGYDAAIDTLMREFNAATAASVPALIVITLTPATANGVAEAAENEAAAYVPRRPGAVHPIPDPNANPAEWQPQAYSRSSKLTFLNEKPESGQGDETMIMEVDVGGRKAQLEAIGKARFDTKFVRNIFFITNVLRLVRQKLNRELTQSRNVLVSSHAAVASGLTEYGSDPFTPNESLKSAPVGYTDRFSDRDKF